MKQDCAKSLCEFAYTARRQVERAVHSGRENTHYARDYCILGGRDDPALSHALHRIATHPGVAGRRRIVARGKSLIIAVACCGVLIPAVARSGMRGRFAPLDR